MVIFYYKWQQDLWNVRNVKGSVNIGSGYWNHILVKGINFHDGQVMLTFMCCKKNLNNHYLMVCYRMFHATMIEGNKLYCSKECLRKENKYAD